MWQVICFTEEDWKNLAGKLAGSRNENERALHQQLVENFLPNIPKIFRDKERERRSKWVFREKFVNLESLELNFFSFRRLLARRTSSRIKVYEERRLVDLYRQQQELETRKQQRALQESVTNTRAKLSESRAKRAERRLEARAN